MPNYILSGLENLLNNPQYKTLLGENVGYLGHEASVTRDLTPGYLALHGIIGKRLKKLFGPQHGFHTLDQDNMIETPHGIHSQLQIPVFSLYAEARQPTDEMLDGLDTLIIDLQDVGTRVYTYIWTTLLCLKACQSKDIRVLILDRPNPVGGIKMEGNLPLPNWYSFVCMDQLPMRHGLTLGELTKLFVKTQSLNVSLEVIPMKGWTRDMLWKDTGLCWVNPSPNLATPESAIVYPGTVLFEGTVLSEGRGTTRSLETIGHPELDPMLIKEITDKDFQKKNFGGFYLRPTFFKPGFDKYAGKTCGGFQIHPADIESFRPWALGQHLLRIFYHHLTLKPFWNNDPYEYETENLAIDYINGNPLIRMWIEKNGSFEELDDLETKGYEEFLDLRQQIIIY